MLKPALIALACLWLAGCNPTSSSQFEMPNGKTKADTATVILGLDTPLSSRWRVWNYSAVDNSVNEKASDDYAVVGVGSHHGLMMMQVLPDNTNSTRFGPDAFVLKGQTFFQYCTGGKLPAVPLKAGDVVYVGDIHMWWTDSGDIGVNYAHDFEKAKKYVQKEYPALVDKLQDRPFNFYLIASAQCT